jgi:DNA polymerase-3 subunit alpha
MGKAKGCLDKMKPISQAVAKGHPEDKLENMERLGSLAEYAFNKSHSTCYAWIVIKQLI